MRNRKQRLITNQDPIRFRATSISSRAPVLCFDIAETLEPLFDACARHVEQAESSLENEEYIDEYTVEATCSSYSLCSPPTTLFSHTDTSLKHGR